MTELTEFAVESPGKKISARRDEFTMTRMTREFAVTARTLRHYEDKGLLAPRREGTSRFFSPRDRARLKLVLQGKRVGFSLDEITEMLDLYDLKDGQETQMKVALAKFRERIERLEAQRREIDSTIADLARTCTVIEGLLKSRQSSDHPADEGNL